MCKRLKIKFQICVQIKSGFWVVRILHVYIQTLGSCLHIDKITPTLTYVLFVIFYPFAVEIPTWLFYYMYR